MPKSWRRDIRSHFSNVRMGWFNWILRATFLLQSIFKGSGLHHWSRNVAFSTGVPYNRTRSDCYRKYSNTHKVVVTSLLPPGNKHEGELNRMLNSIPNLLASTPSDLVLFHTGWPDNQLALLQHSHPSITAITCVATEDWIGPEFRSWEFVERGFHEAGYRSMCRWYSTRVSTVPYFHAFYSPCLLFFNPAHSFLLFTKQVFKALSQMGYEWVIRVDSDSYFPKPIPYNVIDAMVEKDALYGFRLLTRESTEVCRSLPEAASFWLVSEGIEPTFIYDFCNPQEMNGLSGTGWSKTIIYNNFFATKISFWRQSEVQGWLEHLEMVNGF